MKAEVLRGGRRGLLHGRLALSYDINICRFIILRLVRLIRVDLSRKDEESVILSKHGTNRYDKNKRNNRRIKKEYKQEEVKTRINIFTNKIE